MKTPSYIGESSAIIAVIYFLLESFNYLPNHLILIPIITGIISIINWMNDGIADKGICKDCL